MFLHEYSHIKTSNEMVMIFGREIVNVDLFDHNCTKSR
jgi:hypothetical protein